MEYSVRPISIIPNVFLHSCTVQRLNLKPRLHHLTLFIGTYFGNSSSNHSFQSFCYNFNFVPCNGHFQSFTFNHILWAYHMTHMSHHMIWSISFEPYFEKQKTFLDSMMEYRGHNWYQILLNATYFEMLWKLSNIVWHFWILEYPFFRNVYDQRIPNRHYYNQKAQADNLFWKAFRN